MSSDLGRAVRSLESKFRTCSRAGPVGSAKNGGQFWAHLIYSLFSQLFYLVAEKCERYSFSIRFAFD